VLSAEGTRPLDKGVGRSVVNSAAGLEAEPLPPTICAHFTVKSGRILGAPIENPFKFETTSLQMHVEKIIT
jgi:hypothetical protein